MMLTTIVNRVHKLSINQREIDFVIIGEIIGKMRKNMGKIGENITE